MFVAIHATFVAWLGVGFVSFIGTSSAAGIALRFVAFSFVSIYVLLLMRMRTVHWSSRAPLIALSLSVYAAMIAADYVLSQQSKSTHAIAAEAQSLPFDSRPLREVILDDREQGVESYPPSAHGRLRRAQSSLTVSGKHYFPLSGVSNASIVLCNETGFYIRFMADRFGFRNPDSMWENNHLEAVILGDSMGHGACVQDGDTIADRLRTTAPGILNLSISGTSSLHQLGILREMLHSQTVDQVIWLFYGGNDLDEISAEANHPILRRYIEPVFMQNLALEAELINSAHVDFINEELQSSRPSLNWAKIQDSFTISYLRQGFPVRRTDREPIEPTSNRTFSLLEKIASLIKVEAAVLGADVLFVYLPSFNYITGDNRYATREAHEKDIVLEIMATTGIDTLDVERLLRASPDPLSWFPLRISGHYNATGYEAIADAISRRLWADH